MGSVKEIIEESAPFKGMLGKGSFLFSDDYSVFDWGKMPDSVPGKGAVLCMLGAFNFRLLEREGIRTHYLGLMEEGKVKGIEELSGASNEMKIALTVKPRLPFRNGKYEYEAFREKCGNNFLVPLEIIYRNFLPPGSSVRARFSPRDLGLDFGEWPEESLELEKPVIDFSTKLEKKDRYLRREEAIEISCLGENLFSELEGIAFKVNEVISKHAESRGFKNEDGKIEAFYFNDELFVADVCGTFDENRFSFQGREVSKEVARQHYKRIQPEWVEAVDSAKKTAARSGAADWKKYCGINPKPLPKKFLELFSEMYRAGANQYLDRKWFEARSLKEVLGEIYSKGR